MKCATSLLGWQTTTALILLTLVWSTPLPATITFHRVYGGLLQDWGSDVMQTDDGGYAICGATWSFANWHLYSDTYVIKTDSLGQLVWHRAYGGALRDSGAALCPTANSGYLIVGHTESFGQAYPGYPDVYVVNIDSIGDTVWTRTYGGAGYDMAYGVEQTHDGGYVIAGCESPSESGLPNLLLLKIDSLGDVSWSATYGGDSHEQGFSIQQTSDLGYIVVGTSASYGAGDTDVYLLKTDSLGDTLWTRTYGGAYSDAGYSVEQTPDLGYIVAGYTTSSPGYRCVYLVKTDSLGGRQWDRAYVGSWDNRAYSVHRTSDGGYILAGHTYVYGGPHCMEAYLIKTDSLGDTLWTRTFGGAHYDFGKSVEQTRDGGYVVVGRTSSFGAGQYDVYLVKTGPRGVSELRDAAVFSLDEPRGRVFADSLYSVKATVGNLGQVPLTFDIIAAVDDYSDTVQVVQLGVDSTVHIEFKEWLVPPADSVVYTVGVCAYEPADFDTTDNCVEEPVFGRQPFHDVGTVRVESPPDVVLNDSVCPVEFSVRNYGDFTETFRVQCAINGYADEAWVEGFPPGASAVIRLDDWSVPSNNCTTYTMKFCAYMPNDANRSNDGGVRPVYASENHEPLILSARASDGEDPIPGVDGDDYVLIVFDETTNRPGIEASNIDDVLALSNGHTWRDGRKKVRGVEWNERGDTLCIFLSTAASLPSLVVADEVTPDGMTIHDRCGNRAGTAAVITGSFDPVGVGEALSTRTPRTFRLLQNRPNPFRDRTLINYIVPHGSEAGAKVCLTVQNISGRTIETLVNRTQEPGAYCVPWVKKDNPDGVYFYTLRVGESIETRKMVILE